MAKDYGNERLGGPPGLYDAGNCDRASDRSIVTRVRVPAQSSPPETERIFPMGPYNTLSLNDSDNLEDAMGMSEEQSKIEEQKKLSEGIAFRKDITGGNM